MKAAMKKTMLENGVDTVHTSFDVSGYAQMNRTGYMVLPYSANKNVRKELLEARELDAKSTLADTEKIIGDRYNTNIGNGSSVGFFTKKEGPEWFIMGKKIKNTFVSMMNVPFDVTFYWVQCVRDVDEAEIPSSYYGGAGEPSARGVDQQYDFLTLIGMYATLDVAAHTAGNDARIRDNEYGFDGVAQTGMINWQLPWQEDTVINHENWYLGYSEFFRNTFNVYKKKKFTMMPGVNYVDWHSDDYLQRVHQQDDQREATSVFNVGDKFLVVQMKGHHTVLNKTDPVDATATNAATFATGVDRRPGQADGRAEGGLTKDTSSIVRAPCKMIARSDWTFRIGRLEYDYINTRNFQVNRPNHIAADATNTQMISYAAQSALQVTEAGRWNRLESVEQEENTKTH